jgi:hypothetical protein
MRRVILNDVTKNKFWCQRHGNRHPCNGRLALKHATGIGQHRECQALASPGLEGKDITGELIKSVGQKKLREEVVRLVILPDKKFELSHTM